MDGRGLLTSIGLLRKVRPAGFCPACRVALPAGEARRELARPAAAALVVLAVAGAAWAAAALMRRTMGGKDMGLGSIGTFTAAWAVMMAAIMLPSAIPVVLEFARGAEGRLRWRLATGVLAVTYLGVWLAFGGACYGIYTAAGMPWPHQELAAGLALVLAGIYSLTPIKRASQARCREVCALHDPLPFNLVKGAVVAGARYGLSCVGCSAALMVAMVLMGMSGLWWSVVLGVVVAVYKLAPPLKMRFELALAVVVAGLGAAYAAIG